MAPRHGENHNDLLVVRCQLGEPAAFDDLVEAWHRRLWSYIRRLTDDDESAAEAIQETWLRVLRGLPRLRETGRFAPWIHRIARNVVMDRLRGEYSKPRTSDVDPDSLQGAPVLSGRELDLDALRRELVSLPLLERDVLTLFYVQDLSLLETAEVLDIPVGTVKSRLFRARGLLREKLQAATSGVCR